MPTKYSNDAVKLNRIARQEAQKLGAKVVEVPHLILAIATTDSLETKALADVGLTYEVLRERIAQLYGAHDRTAHWIDPSRETMEVRERAVTIAEARHHAMVKPRHVLQAALTSEAGYGFIGGAAVIRKLSEAIKRRRRVRSSSNRAHKR